jgi:hypothetical protein
MITGAIKMAVIMTRMFKLEAVLHLSYRFTSESKPAAEKSFDCCCLSHFRTWSGMICVFRLSLREFLYPVMNCFMRQTLATVTRKHLFMNILCTKSFLPTKKRTKERCSSVVYSSSTVAILTTETRL